MLTKDDVIERIEIITSDVLAQLDSGRLPTLPYASSHSWDDLILTRSRGLQRKYSSTVSRLSLQRDSGVVTFATVMRVLSTAHELLSAGRTATKRDIYYADVPFFGSQRRVDTAVVTISRMLGVPRWCLNITATAVGLIAGDVVFRDGDTLVDCRNQATLVPPEVTRVNSLVSAARFVLVVEKDASFQTILESSFLAQCGPGILVTAKGFPDISSRRFLCLLRELLQVPMLALVDGDPHGLEIFATYKFGSRNADCENEFLVVPSLQLIGILPSEAASWKLAANQKLPFTKMDFSKLRSLQTRQYLREDAVFAHEIAVLSAVKQKVEIQCVDSVVSGYLVDTYLPRKLAELGLLPE